LIFKKLQTIQEFAFLNIVSHFGFRARLLPRLPNIVGQGSGQASDFIS
jgi:hypothetical protein